MWSPKLKTSGTQFEIMVIFMEQHGDLNKGANSPRSRIQIMQHWEQLTSLLNSDSSVEKKSTERWKKVWSDLKNNTKRKAAKLHRAACSNDGSLVTLPKLSDIEQRVLNIIGTHYVTVVDAGFSTEIPITEVSNIEENAFTQDSDRTVTSLSSPPQPTPPVSPSPIYSGVQNIRPKIEDVECPIVAVETQEWEQPGSSLQPDVSPPLISVSPTQLDSIIPAIEGHMPRRRHHSMPPRSKLSRRRRGEQSADSFIKYVIEKGRADTELEKERLRLREMELNVQKTWQGLAVKAIDALNKVLDYKISKESENSSHVNIDY